MKRTYGWGIVDRFGAQWWSESCVCQDKAPIDEQCADLNEPIYIDKRKPYRVVRLTYDWSAAKPAGAKGRRK